MIEKADLSAIAKSVSVIVREWTERLMVSMAELEARLDARIKAIPAGPKGDPGPAGEAGQRGDNGKDADPGLVRDLVLAEVKAPISDDVAVKLKAAIAGIGFPIPKDGLDGKDGRDADPELVRSLVAADLQPIVIQEVGVRLRDAIAGLGLTVPKDGKDGVDGAPGAPGKDADPIHPDTLSLMVIREVEKAVAALPKAIDGKDGADGRDALQIEIQPAIDPSKSVPRGTFAKHRGGLLRAARNTTPGEFIDPKEWDVITEGVSDVLIKQGENAREFTVESFLTSGLVFTSKFALPVLIYREIYRDGTEYNHGDVVTYGGSAWHCMAESTKAKPGTGQDWKLMVKEGQRAKDGPPGERGPEGKPGRDGRDLTQVDYDGRKH